MIGAAQKAIFPHPRSVEYWRASKKQFPISISSHASAKQVPISCCLTAGHEFVLMKSEMGTGAAVIEKATQGKSGLMEFANWLRRGRCGGAFLSGPCALLVAVQAFGQANAPYAATQPATEITFTSAKLNGIAVPNGLPSTAWFEWGLRGAYTKVTTPAALGEGLSVVPVRFALEGLTKGGSYQFRVGVSNAAGVAYGPRRMFACGGKVAAWGDNSSGQCTVPQIASNAVAVAGGGYHSLALLADGTVTAWGYNVDGEAAVPPGLSNAVAVAAGTYHSLALKSDGTVVAWGAGGTNANHFLDYGQSIVPSALTDAVAIAAGDYYSAALRSNGTVIAWGRNESGQTKVPPDLTNVVALAGGGKHCLALKADGSVVAWGGNGYGQASVPPGLGNSVAVSAGGLHSLVLRADGTVVTWGQNSYGQTNVPAGLTNVLAIASGYYHNAALRADGAVTLWGDSDSGQADVPLTLTGAVAVACGGFHNLTIGPKQQPVALAQSASGPANRDQVITLGALDYNNDALELRISTLPAQGQLYQYTTNRTRGPLIDTLYTSVTDTERRVLFAPNANQFGSPYATFSFVAKGGELVSAPATVTISILTAYGFTQDAMCLGPDSVRLNGMAVPNGLATAAWFEWGTRQMYSGRTDMIVIGNDTVTVPVSEVISALLPHAIYRCRLVVSNAAGVVYGAPKLFTTGKTVTVWDKNSSGIATVIAGVSNVVAASAGESHSAVLRSDGTIQGWGTYWDGSHKWPVTNYPTTFPPTPPLRNISDAVALASGANHTLILKSDGSLQSCGGSNKIGDYPYWLYAPGWSPELSNIVAIAAGAYQDMAVTAEGLAACWGFYRDDALYYQYGQYLYHYRAVGVPNGLSNVVAVAAGSAHSVVLEADGTLSAWGWGRSGDKGRFGQANIPVGLTNIVSIAAGDWHTLALRADGTVAAWGGNSSGQTNVPAGLSNVVAIAAGGNQSLALTGNGEVLAWGAVAAPIGLSNVVQIAAGTSQSIAVLNSAPTGVTQSSSGTANSDQMIVLAGTDPDGDVLHYRITSLPSQGTLFQCGAGQRGQPISTPNTIVTDPEHRIIFSPETNGFGAPYSAFGFVADDGEAVSSAAIVTINVEGNPRAFTRLPLGIGPDKATLSGSAVLNGLSGEVWFEWGPLGGFGSTTEPMSARSGIVLAHVTAAIAGLTNGGIYQCRLVVSNAAELVRSGTRLFTTGGKVAAWGDDVLGTGATKVPPGLSNAVEVAGYSQSLVLKSDGTLFSWGSQGTVPSGLSNVVAVACGDAYSIALKGDGTLAAWGNNGSGQCNIPSGCSNVVAIAAGRSHNLVLKEDGTVMAWGQYMYGGLATVPAGLSNVVAIGAGDMHSIALKTDGTVVAWGNVPPPPPGPPFSVGQDKVPLGLSNVVGIAACATHNLALLSNGKVFAWGDYSNGECSVPTSLSNVVEIAGGWRYSMALKADGALVTWGYLPNVVAGVRDIAVIAGGNMHDIVIGKDIPPSVSSRSLYGPANRDVVITLTASDLNSDNLSLRVASLPIGGQLYQYAAGLRGLPISETNTLVTDLSGRVIFAPNVNWYGSTSFVFVANDGEVDSVPGQVRVTIQRPVIPIVFGWGMGSNGYFVTFTGDSNTTYCVWSSTNLVDWGCMGQPGQTTPGHFFFLDETARATPQQFYRVSTGCSGQTP